MFAACCTVAQIVMTGSALETTPDQVPHHPGTHRIVNMKLRHGTSRTGRTPPHPREHAACGARTEATRPEARAQPLPAPTTPRTSRPTEAHTARTDTPHHNAAQRQGTK